MKIKVTPLGALVRGLAAGAIGAGIQELFFRATSRMAPRPPEGAFEPPEEEQRDESPTHTVARRFVESLAQRGPLSDEQKRVGGELVHYGFGGAWGGLYGLARESAPAVRSLLGISIFSTVVMGVSDGLILPAFRLSPWPNAYPLRSHAYSLGAHLVYGAATAVAYELLRGRPVAQALALAWSVRARIAGRKLPRWMRPLFERTVEAARPIVH